ncbi:hypothetical protein HZS_3047 [Henneguya salminicola]|nr:hypothetical protein HZS_3047 [Henneguya salminicola]
MLSFCFTLFRYFEQTMRHAFISVLSPHSVPRCKRIDNSTIRILKGSLQCCFDLTCCGFQLRIKIR